MVGMPAAFARFLRAAIRRAIGSECSNSLSASTNSRSLMTSIRISATSESSGTLPWRSSFFAGIAPLPSSLDLFEERLLLDGVARQHLIPDRVEQHGEAVTRHPLDRAL